MIKTIIAALILLTLPLLSQADMGIYEGISIGSNVDVSLSDPTVIDVNSSTTSNTDNKNITTYSTSTTQIQVEEDGFFRKMMNWFKSWFR